MKAIRSSNDRPSGCKFFMYAALALCWPLLVLGESQAGETADRERRAAVKRELAMIGKEIAAEVSAIQQSGMSAELRIDALERAHQRNKAKIERERYLIRSLSRQRATGAQ